MRARVRATRPPVDAVLRSASRANGRNTRNIAIAPSQSPIGTNSMPMTSPMEPISLFRSVVEVTGSDDDVGRAGRVDVGERLRLLGTGGEARGELAGAARELRRAARGIRCARRERAEAARELVDARGEAVAAVADAG